MNYPETLAWLFAQLPMYQRIGQAAYKNNLDNTLELDRYFNHPHREFKSIHIAGTNGKGSVSHMLASVLQEAGYKTGLYTSPHLKDFRERIKINGEMIPETYVTRFIETNREFFERLRPSFFEMTVAMAFRYFADCGVEIAVVETGLGGRLDSTNIVEPELSVITNISFDHTALLGGTLPEIAREKAGIIKANTPIVAGTYDPACAFVFIQKADECNAPLTFASRQWNVEKNEAGNYNVTGVNGCHYPDLACGLKGAYQRKNIPVLLEAAEILQRKGFAVHEKDIRAGLRQVIPNTGLSGRWQQLNERPLTICDTGHNEDGIREITAQLKSCTYRKLHIVFGMVNDKDISGVLSLLPADAVYYFCKASIPRSLDENRLAEQAGRYGLRGTTHPTVAEAYAAARQHAAPEDMIYIGGSTFVVAELL
ncbi:MAG: bifunctional folylpolyglutamate synthase/dihydrofolate synthase [Culturomica sp.]|jgi:dihydrofolate synthase/folylpolyglutamate synthase|nr:bifunctional folylpolyglutamate synthase/dihydrofolate synthase [Culturomica sp.]